MQKIKERYLYCNLCSALIITVTALFLFMLRYDVPMYGDDVGGLVANNPDSTYIDDRVVEGDCVLDLDYSVGTSWNKLTYSYFMWNGRVTTKIVTPLIRIIFSLPDGIDWLIFSIYIMFFLLVLLLLVVRVICGSMKTAMKKPFVILLTGVLLFYIPSYSYAYMTRLIMYTFTNIYVISVILYLAFYTVLEHVFAGHAGLQTGGRPAVKTLVGCNLLGLLAGLSHEAYGVIFGVVLLTQLIRFWFINHRRISVRYLFMYIGYFVGFCICFFAPGNFNRAQQSHEDTLRTVSVFTRIFNSIYIHAFVAYKIWIIPIVVLPVVIVLLAVLLRKKILTVRDILSAVGNNLEWFLGFAMSALTWGIVARVVNYGMLAANVMMIVGVIKVFRELWIKITERKRATGQARWHVRAQMILAGLSVACIVLLGAKNFADMAVVHQRADVWRENICRARKEGLEEVTVPAYPEELDGRFYDLDAINAQGRYDRTACRVVYGTHIVIENGGMTDG